MNTSATSRQNHNKPEGDGRSRRRAGRFVAVGAILIGSMAVAGTAGAANPDPGPVGDTDDVSRRPGDVPTYSIKPTVPDFRHPAVEDYRRRIDLDTIQEHDGDLIESCDDDCPPHEDQGHENDDPVRDDGDRVDDPGGDNYDEDYDEEYPHGCGEDELVACPDKYPTDELNCEDHRDEICDEYVPEEIEYGTTTTVVTDDYEPTTTTTPLEQVDVEVRGKQTGGDSLAYTGSSSKLPLIGAGLLAAGGLAAGLSFLSRRDRTGRA